MKHTANIKDLEQRVKGALILMDMLINLNPRAILLKTSKQLRKDLQEMEGMTLEELESLQRLVDQIQRVTGPFIHLARIAPCQQ